MSNTSWTRLRPLARDPEMESSLEASLHDPLWMLARQWTFGEFQGEDAGSPVKVELKVVSTPLTQYTPRPGAADTTATPYDLRREPLETTVERERVRGEDGGNRRLAAEAGLYFLRLLAAKKATRYRAAFVEAYPLHVPDAAASSRLDSATLRFLGVVGNRVPDGASLHRAFTQAPAPRGGGRGLPERPTIAAADRAKVVAAVEAWLAWYDGGVFSEPPAAAAPDAQSIPSDGARAPTAWVRERMEYAFSVAATATGQRVVLSAPEYVEGHLDWFAFDLRAADPPAPRATPGHDPTHVVLPTPVTYRGMPASRYWEFEDARVNLSAVRGGLADVGRLLMLEFALVYGNDWYVVPVELEVGSLSRIAWLRVTNAFGDPPVEVRPYDERPAAGTEWAMFTPALEQGAAIPRTAAEAEAARALGPLLVLPPSLVSSLHSPPIEDVLFVRDEMANLAWAVERVVESGSGRPLDRYEQVLEQRRRSALNQPPTGAAAARVAYELGTEVPANWIPLVPVPTGAGTQFERGRMGTATPPDPLGRILEAGERLTLREEEVPRAGARVTRAYQYTRWIDGSTHLWIGRRKAPGRGEASSNLQFDRIRAPDPSE